MRMRAVTSWWSVALSGVLALVALAVGTSAAGSMPMAEDDRAVALVASCGADEFEGDVLDDARWDVLRPAGGGPVVSAGALRLPIRPGDLIGGTASAENLVLQEAPTGGWTATTKLTTAAIDANGEQAGLVLWKGEGPPSSANTFGKIVAIQTNGGARTFEAVWTDAGALAVPTANSGSSATNLPAEALLRLRSDGSTVTAEFSADDGASWTQIGQRAHYDGALRVGAVAMGGASAAGTVAFERFTLSCAPTVSASTTEGTAPLAVNFTAADVPSGATLTWNFGDGGTSSGGTTAQHTFTEPGTYRVSLTATTAAGDVTSGATRVVVRAPSGHPATDDFNGNALDPKWEILRPRLTGIRFGGGHLRLQSYGGDMHGGNASARNVLLQPLPETAATVSTKIDVSGLTATGDQVGLIAWRAENPSSFAKIVFNRRGTTQYWFERSRSEGTGTTGGNSGAVNGPVPSTVYLRIRSDGAANPTLTPESSLNGTSWSAVQAPFSLPGSGPVKVGLTYFSGDAFRTAGFDWFQVVPNLFTTIGITRSETRQNSQIFGTPTPYSLPGEEMPPSRTVGPAPNDTFDDVPLRMPDTSGNVPNLAAFRGQTLFLRPEDQKQYSKIHFFGTTTDGGPAGGDFLLRYDDGTTQSILVQFSDWCGPQNSPSHHWAIGPLSKRWRTQGEDGATCGIYHVPANAQGNKKLVSVTLPPNTSPGNPPIQSYLMALTLEQPDGVFEMPDLSGTLQFPDDQIAPVSTHAFEPAAPDGADGWYKSPIRVTLSATDAGGSEVEQMMWRVSGGTPQSYGGPFSFAQEGAHEFEYRAIDGAGNAEGYKGVAIKVDPNAPETVPTLSPTQPFGTDDWHDGAVKVTLTARDGQGSGARTTEYRIDGGDWAAYEEPVTVEDAGVHVLEYRSSDVAGNTEAVRSLRVKVDKTPPITTAQINGAAPVTRYAGPVRVALVRDDGDGSGAVSSEYRIGGDGPWTSYTGAFDVGENGGHRVDFRSRDLVGNVENFRTVVFRIDPVPVVPGAPPEAVPPPFPPPYAALGPVAPRRATVAALRRGRLAVRVSCQGVDGGAVRLTVSRATAKRLRLPGRVLARRTVRCGDEGRATVTLRPSRAVKRALARSSRAITATLSVGMSGEAGTASDQATVVLRGN
jgi:PKD repeat protein